MDKRYTLDQYFANYPQIGPGEIRHLLKWASEALCQRLVIIFDEFDRLAGPERGLFADTIKDLSDNSVDVTIILVGVASDTVHLIAEHASITRCLRQIVMPLMDRKELMEIIEKAMPRLKMNIDELAAKYIISLSQGLAHYTHLLGKEASLRAIRSQSSKITPDDVLKSVDVALEQTDLTIRDSYHKATHGTRVSELFPDVLLACALANVDHLGFFKSSDVCEPLRMIRGEEYRIADFSSNLEKLSSSADRGPVLERIGQPRKYKYRFSNPLLRPFILLKGLTEDSTSEMILNILVPSEPERNAEERLLFE